MEQSYFNKDGNLTTYGKQYNRTSYEKLEKLDITIQSINLYLTPLDDEQFMTHVMPDRPNFNSKGNPITYYNNFAVDRNVIQIYTGTNYDGTIAFIIQRKDFKFFNKVLKEYCGMDFNDTLVSKNYDGRIIIVFKLSSYQIRRMYKYSEIETLDVIMFGRKITVFYNYGKVPISGIVRMNDKQVLIKLLRYEDVQEMPEFIFLELINEVRCNSFINYEESIDVVEISKKSDEDVTSNEQHKTQIKVINENLDKNIQVLKNSEIEISENIVLSITRLLTFADDNEIGNFFKTVYDKDYIYDTINKVWYRINEYGIYKRDTDELIDARIRMSTDLTQLYMKYAVPIIKSKEGHERELINKAYSSIIKSLQTLYKKKLIIEILKEKYSTDDLIMKMNSNLHLFAFENGVYDMKTFTFRKAEPSDLVFGSNGYKYHPSSKEDRQLIKKTIKDMFLTEELYIYFMSIISLRLVRINEKEEFYFMIGDASNGKGLVTSLIQNMFGRYSQVLDSSSFYKNKHGVHSEAASPALASTKDSNIVFVNELDRDTKLTADQIKKLSGNDMIKTRFLRQDFFEFIPGYSLFFVSNHKPDIDGDDCGIQRRLKLIPFNITFKDDPKLPNERKINRKLKQIFKDKRYSCALFDILVKFYKKCVDINFEIPVPEEVLVNSDKYLDENDPVKQFITNCIDITRNENDRINSSVLNDLFKTYNNGSRGYTAGKLKIKLNKDFRIETKQTNKGIVYLGIKQKEDIEQDYQFVD